MKTLIAVLKLLPLIVSTVRVLESEIPVSGKGKNKLDFILGVTEVVAEVAPDVTEDIPKNKLVEIITGIVGRVVIMFNTAGVFGK